jgi:hypothetical protein
VSYYSVSQVHESPEPPALPPEGGSGEDFTVLPAGTEVLCEPGDVAVDFTSWGIQFELQWSDPDPQPDWSTASTRAYSASEDVWAPIITSAGDAPTGFRAEREVLVVAGANGYDMGTGSIDYFAFRTELHLDLTCSDLTPQATP